MADKVVGFIRAIGVVTDEVFVADMEVMLEKKFNLIAKLEKKFNLIAKLEKKFSLVSWLEKNLNIKGVVKK